MSDAASLKEFWCPKKKLDGVQKRALYRLMKDLQVVKNNPLPSVVAYPLENDLFHWHGNLRGPAQSPLEGGIFHFAMEFPSRYPEEPPRLKFFTPMPHPFVFDKTICLRLTGTTTIKGVFNGWSPIYDVQSILRQLQSFLIDGLEASDSNTGHNIEFSQKQTSQWKVVFENRDQRGEGTLSPSEIRELLLEVGERKPSEEELALYYHMQHIPYDQPIAFCSFLNILRLKREYRKVVDNFNRFTCSKCSHAAQKPHPPLPALGGSAFTQTLSLPEIYAAETECFFTKRSFTSPDSASIGVGVSLMKNPRNGQIHKVLSSLNFVSLNAFRKHEANRSHDSSDKFTHWLPLYLNDEHGQVAMHLLPRSLGVICTGSHRDFRPEMVLTVLPKLIGGFVQQAATGICRDVVKALHVYTQFHHLFLVIFNRYPQVRVLARAQLLNFINDPSSRNKDHVSNLSDLLSLMFVIGSPEEEKEESEPIDLATFYAAVISEINVRSVLWILKKNPELVKDSSDEKLDANRIANSFESSKAGFQLLLLHKFLYQHVAHTSGTKSGDLIQEYNERLGRPTQMQINHTIKEFERFTSLPHYVEVYQRLKLPVPDDAALLQELYHSIQVSTKYNYHCKRVIQVQSADEYLKEKLKNFISLDELVDEEGSKKLSEQLGKKAFLLKDNEALYQKLCIQRFGATDLPPVDAMLSEILHPWQHYYLKLNMEDMLCKFNENPDFKRFYNVIGLSAASLISLEFTVVPVTNVKSNFFYLTALLSNMFNLEKFTVKKGEIFLDLKGCKALCKGLKNNPNSLKVLDLHYCHITEDRVKILEDGLLSSKNLISLNMEGNPIGTVGAASIAKVLRAHGQITHLNVGSCALLRDAAVVLGDAFYHNKSLRVVNISKNQIDSIGLATIFRQLSYSRTIERIEIIRNAYEGDHTVGIELTRLFEVSTSLKFVNFYKTQTGRFCNDTTFHGLSQNRSITELDFGSSGLGARVSPLGWALARNKNISILHLENSGIGGGGIQALSEAIYDTQAAIDAREKVRGFRDLTAAEITEDLRPRGCSLEVLNLSHNTSVITSPTQMLALERLVSLTTTIVDLNLSYCGLGVPAGEALGRGIAGHPSLLKLNLKGNDLDEYGIKKLCKGLHDNSVLKELDISRNSIRGRGASAVGQLLANAKCNIEVLNLHGNFIGIEGARFIATALQSNTTLTDLDLGLNRMRPKGVFAISQALQKNSTLLTLRLKQNFINDRTAMELSDVLKTQSSVRKLCLAGNKVKDAILNTIVKDLSECEVPVSVDVANMLNVTQANRLQCTVYCTPLPQDISSNSLKKLFYDGGCGAIVNVSVLKHSRKADFSAACYAFVEFAEADSVQLALDIGAEGKAKIGRNSFSVIQAQGHKAV